MVNLKIREQLPDCAIVFENASYDNSIIGITLDGRAIYDFNLMVKEYAEENDCDEVDAIEWIEYNTMRALPYCGEKAPEVVNWV